jgi:ribonucleoside-diphosphate reductase beta chain
MSVINEKIFNTNKTDYERTPLFLGQSPGLFDTINKNHPKIWDLYKKMRSLDWDENEFNFTICNTQFKTCPKSTYDMMIMSLAWQWEGDSTAARSLISLVAPFVSSSELFAAWSEISTNEVVHAATYSEIVRNSFDNPQEVFHEVLKIKESLSRLDSVAEVMSNMHDISHRYALGELENNQELFNEVFMFVVAMYCLERIQFMASFCVTFTIAETGDFLPIGKAVQKIAQDELEIHSELDRIILEYLLQTERGRIAMAQCKGRVKKLLDDVVNSELNWSEVLFSGGRELPGMDSDRLKQWSLFCAAPVYHNLDVEPEHKLPEKNPVKFMENWLDISKTQPSPQEEANGQYKLNVVRRDDEETIFEVDF